MKRALPLALAGLSLAILAVAGWQRSTPAHAITNCDTSTAAMDAQELRVLELLNAERVKNNVTVLKPSPTLNRAAAWMAEWQDANNQLSHTDSYGRTLDRLKDCGYPGGFMGENAGIAGSADQIFQGWMGSPGHKSNMLNANFRAVGIGQSGGYWTMTLGSTDDSGAPQPTDSPSSPTPTRTSTTAGPSPSATATRTATPSPTPTSTPQPSIWRVRTSMIASEPEQ